MDVVKAQQIEQKLNDFEKLFRSKGNEPLQKYEKAVLRTYIGYKLFINPQGTITSFEEWFVAQGNSRLEHYEELIAKSYVAFESSQDNATVEG